MPFDRDNLHFSAEHLQDLLPQRVLKTTMERKQIELRAKGFDVSAGIFIPPPGFIAASEVESDKFAGVQTRFGLTLVYVPTRADAEDYYQFLCHQPCFGPSRVARCVATTCSQYFIVQLYMQLHMQMNHSVLGQCSQLIHRYHGGMSDAARGEVHEAFQKNEFDVLIATLAFGGSSIRQVACIPASPTNNGKTQHFHPILL
jgi:hypothetical protein